MPDRRQGLVFGIGAYVLWGVLPLYLTLVGRASALEVIAHRIVWTAVLCAGALVLARQWAPLRRAVGRPKVLGAMALAGVLLTANWLVFVWATLNGHLVDAALGYFINPLFSVLLGVVLLHERLRAAQWTAVGIGALAVVVIAATAGRLPWVALVLPLTFGFYGYVEKLVGRSVPAFTALAVETAVVLPAAVGHLIWLGVTGRGTFVVGMPGHDSALLGLGVATAAPLLLFNAAARRLPLSLLGFLQYLCPVMQFITGLLLFHEPMSGGRWFGFAAVWAALATLTGDALWRSRRAASGGLD
ncbi:MAG: EamA family transporter RarD [Bifidobacteriaceae bacterium]|jgi:chloramphenicol-sensitive protein RarD|nr:EamA family transporter RarD [Bifidobacteriaceae bacterium]